MTQPEAPRTNRRRITIIVASSVAFLLLCTGALYVGAARGASQQPAAAASDSATGEPTPDATARIVPAGIPSATAVRTCTVSALAKDARLATFSGDVTDAATGAVLFTRDGKEPGPTASLLKLLTASAAINVLGPDYRMTTTVVAGTEPGSIVLVGGGDPTLSRTAVGEQSYYADAPKLADLAAQVYATIGTATPITKIVLDSSYWDPSDDWDSSWAASDLTDGYQSQVTALQVDGDRATPSQAVSPRSTQPVMNAGMAFATALGVPAAALEIGTAPDNAQVLGSVESQPMSNLIPAMLRTSDGSLAESIARVTSIESGSDGSSASLQKVIGSALDNIGLDIGDSVIRDGSGLSPKDAVSPRFLTKLLRAVQTGDDDLNYVYKGLSVAGENGGLKTRFSGANAVARGHVTGKVGHIDIEYSLAGIVDAADGTQLSFAFFAVGDVGEGAKAALDTLTTAIYNCGANLSNK